jgi:hypothetical protein
MPEYQPDSQAGGSAEKRVATPNDGLFDHVAPAIPPAGTEGEYVTVAKSPGGTVSNNLWVGPGLTVGDRPHQDLYRTDRAD